MKERLKTVWKNHKAAIVALAAALVGSLLTYLGVRSRRRPRRST
jgi:hypothetical protein